MFFFQLGALFFSAPTGGTLRAQGSQYLQHGQKLNFLFSVILFHNFQIDLEDHENHGPETLGSTLWAPGPLGHP